MNTTGLSKVRSEVLQQVISSGEEPFDIAFVKTNNGIVMCPIDLQGDFPTSYKHKARKEVVYKIINKQVPQIKNAIELTYFSFDPILNVDYCFEIYSNSKQINLYIFSTTGMKVCEFKPYNLNSDERIEIERSIKSTKRKTSSFASLKEKFSKLLGSNKPETLRIVPSEEPIEITISSSHKTDIANAKTSEKSKIQPKNEQSFVEEVLSRLDTPKFQMMRSAGMGFNVISISLSTFTTQMIEMYPEWDGLFDFDSEKDHVRVTCKKGFEDRITKMAIPYLWKRKSFIENCILFGVEKIVFLDPISNTFDLLKVSTVNPKILN